jgi:hypothetical protein
MSDELEIPVDDDDPDFADLVVAAGNELKRRFKKDPDSLPGTFVIKLWLDGNKAIRAGDAPKQGDDLPPPDLLELVQSEGLPYERKHDLLIAEIVKAEQRVIDIKAALENLERQP